MTNKICSEDVSWIDKKKTVWLFTDQSLQYFEPPLSHMKASSIRIRTNKIEQSFRVLQDGRLRPHDRLIEVNGAVLSGLSNSEAMKTLRQALRPGVLTTGCIDLVVARQRSATAVDNFGNRKSTPRKPIRYADANQHPPTTSINKATSKPKNSTNVQHNTSHHAADGAGCSNKSTVVVAPTTIIRGNTVIIETSGSRSNLHSCSCSSRSHSRSRSRSRSRNHGSRSHSRGHNQSSGGYSCSGASNTWSNNLRFGMRRVSIYQFLIVRRSLNDDDFEET